MRALKITFCFFLFAINFSFANETKHKSFFDFKVKDVQGKEVNLASYKNKVILVVNTASACGFTPQFKDLEELQKKYSSRGFTVLAFPSNDFKQDKGNNSEIEKFAKDKYQITFPIMDKNPVSGKEKQPVYQFLTDSKTGFLFKDVQWNFEKFLIGKDGQVIDRWNSMTSPQSDSIVKKIEAALAN
jgi:glutathione peroxidase